ncbi:hypothetical protein EMIT0P294_40170 [Pseudomonas sp. IT-P294]
MATSDDGEAVGEGGQWNITQLKVALREQPNFVRIDAAHYQTP